MREGGPNAREDSKQQLHMLRRGWMYTPGSVWQTLAGVLEEGMPRAGDTTVVACKDHSLFYLLLSFSVCHHFCIFLRPSIPARECSSKCILRPQMRIKVIVGLQLWHKSEAWHLNAMVI